MDPFSKKEGISTTVDKQTVPDIMKSGWSQDSVNINFVAGSNVNVMDEHKMQVCRTKFSTITS
jgi:hypothetical protein